jgi:hypothetical protein
MTDINPSKCGHRDLHERETVDEALKADSEADSTAVDTIREAMAKPIRDWFLITVAPLKDKNEAAFGLRDSCMFLAVVLGVVTVARVLIAS